jgi:hypothetical protein
MEQNTEAPVNLFELQVDTEATNYLGDTARWAKFLSIVGIVFCGLILLFATYLAAISSSYENAGIVSRAYGMSTGGIAVIYFVFAIVYFFPSLFLLRFSGRMNVALRNNDQILLNRSLRSLRSCFRYIGILTIILIGLMVLFFLLGVINGMH